MGRFFNAGVVKGRKFVIITFIAPAVPTRKGRHVCTRERNNPRGEISMKVSPLAGKPAPPEMLVDVPALVKAYYDNIPDPSVDAQKVSFGTSGHRGSSLKCSFNERHILAITWAICLFREKSGVDGPLFIGMDTHALSAPALSTALEVLAAKGVFVMMGAKDEYTPTPSISRAIISYNRRRSAGLADGIVITPSHNPPEDGGFKYNPPNGGPAEPFVTGWIEAKANELLATDLKEIKRMPFEQAVKAPTVRTYDYIRNYVDDLRNVVDMNVIRSAGIKLGADPLGGAGVQYWGAIAERYNIDLTVVSDEVDPTFSFMSVDWDGRIRMDPSSPYAMARLIGLKDRFDIAFGCDTDHDRHGIVTKSVGLMPPNHFLSAAVYYLFAHRPRWDAQAAVGKTVVSSRMIDKVTEGIGRKLFEVPVGFKWFVDGLVSGSLAFGGEESAGATFVRLDARTWTTDKDAIVPSLLAAEMTARLGSDPGVVYRELTQKYGDPVYDRVEAGATPEQKEALKRLAPEDVKITTLAGEKIEQVLNRAPGNNEPIGGIKVAAKNGWFAARPSGTEDIYKIYAESFKGAEHLKAILEEAQEIVNGAVAVAP